MSETDNNMLIATNYPFANDVNSMRKHMKQYI